MANIYVLITNLEPVYGIILAFMFFGKREQMTGDFYAGAVVVLASIFLYPFVKNRIQKRKLVKQIPWDKSSFPSICCKPGLPLLNVIVSRILDGRFFSPSG